MHRKQNKNKQMGLHKIKQWKVKKNHIDVSNILQRNDIQNLYHIPLILFPVMKCKLTLMLGKWNEQKCLQRIVTNGK